jgi:dTDP-4-dehydrorhamnose reductase
MLRLAAERDSMSVINDQIGAPTGADMLADITAHAIRSTVHQPALCGLYHLVAGGETSWHGYASFVLDYARRAGVSLKVSQESIKAVPTSDFRTAAKRPLNSRMDCSKLENAFNLNLPHWQVGVERMLVEILENTK